MAGSHTLKAEIFKDDTLLATSNELTITVEEPVPEPSLYFTDEDDNVITTATITGMEQKLIKYVGENVPDGATYEITQTGSGITKWSTPPNGFTVMRGVFDDSTITNTFTVNMKVNNEVVATNSIAITSEPQPENNARTELPIEQLYMTMSRYGGSDKLDFTSAFVDISSGNYITDNDISNVYFVVGGVQYSATVTYGFASHYLTFKHDFGATVIPTYATGDLFFTYNGVENSFTLAIDEMR